MSFKGEKLLGSSSEEDDAPDASMSGVKRKPQFKINDSYAKNYENWRSKEELQKLKGRLHISNDEDIMALSEGSSESSSSEEEWDEEKEKSFFRALSCLKKKDPKIYNNDVTFFNKTGQAPSAESQEKVKKKKENNKPYTLKDHERQMALENKLGMEDEATNETDNLPPKYSDLSYVSKLKSIKDEFRNALDGVESGSSDSEAEPNSSKKAEAFRDFLKPREDKDVDKESADYKTWLKNELTSFPVDDPETQYLHDHWIKNEKLDEGEKFLRDYILNRKYMDGDDKGTKGYMKYNDIVHDSDEEGLSGDEKFEETRETFEHKYNFRFEEPDQEFIKRFPRTVSDSLRRPDDRRRLQRLSKKEQEEQRKTEKRMEIQRLKALKRKEIMDKIKQIQETTGEDFLALKDEDLEKDFDPAEYDERMKQVFSEDFYGKDNADHEKPRFDFVEGIDDDVDVPAMDWDELDQGEDIDDANVVDKKTNKVSSAEIEAQPKASSSRQLQQELIESCEGKGGRGQNKRKRKSAFLEALETIKPKFDPSAHSNFQDYFDEYYKLDFEDLIGDLPCRFKYRKVVSNDFGLTTEEILNAPDRELNSWVSLKKTYQYRPDEEELYEVQAYRKKACNKNLKKKVLPSLHEPQDIEQENEDIVNDTPVKKSKKKKKKKKSKKTGDVAVKTEQDANGIPDANEITAAGTETHPKSKKIKIKKEKDANGIPDAKETAATGNETHSKSNKIKINKKEDAGTYENEFANSNTSESTLSKKKRKTQKAKDKSGEKVPLSNKEMPGPVETESNSLHKKQRRDGTNRIDHNEAALPSKDPSIPQASQRKKKKKYSKESKAPTCNVDEERLKAYGINPTKFKKRLKYAPGAS